MHSYCVSSLISRSIVFPVGISGLNRNQVPEQWIARLPRPAGRPAGAICSGFKPGEQEKIIISPPAAAMRQGENTPGFFIG